MRQVPRYAIIGDGRAARHFSRYLSLRSIPFGTWSRKEPRTHLPDLLAASDVVLVLIRDSAIKPWLRALGSRWARSRRFVHFSGALATPLAAGMHPLISFSEELYSLRTYESIPFICEEEGPSFQELFPALRNPSYGIPRKMKPLYHSLCVLSGNFTVLLWRKFFSDMESKLGLPRQAAFPYLERIARNLRRAPDSAFSGPLARRDEETVRSNLAALSGDPFQAVYRALARAVLKEKTR